MSILSESLYVNIILGARRCWGLILSLLQPDLNSELGTRSLDLELLKQYRDSPVASDTIESSGASDGIGPSVARVRIS